MINTRYSICDVKNILNIHLFYFGIVVSQWNKKITSRLLLGVTKTLYNLGVAKSNIKIFKVPGSFELIFITNQLAKSNKFDVIIVIGCIIKGETYHFEYISSAVTNGIKEINLRTDTPVIFCVLTDTHIKQSFDRSGGKYGNKGIESAISAIQIADLKKRINSSIN